MHETSFNTSNSSNKDFSPKRNESFANLDTKIIKDFSFFFNKDVPLHRILYHLEVAYFKRIILI